MPSCKLCGYTAPCAVLIGLHTCLVHLHSDMGLIKEHYPDCQQCLLGSLEPYELLPLPGGKYAMGCAKVGSTYMQAPSACGMDAPVVLTPIVEAGR